MRYILRKAINHYERPFAIGNRIYEFTTFGTLVYKILNESIEFSNPFPNKEKELIEYLKNNYKEIVESIKEFQYDVEKIESFIKKFKAQLILIEQNRLDGLKGRCSVEKSSIIFKIIFFFRQLLHSVSK